MRCDSLKAVVDSVPQILKLGVTVGAGMGGVSFADGPEGAKMIMTEPLKLHGAALVACAGDALT